MLDVVYIVFSLLCLAVAGWLLAQGLAPRLTRNERIVLVACAIALGIVAGNLVRHAT